MTDFYFEPKIANSIFRAIDTRIWILRTIVPKNKYQRTWPWLELKILPTFGHLTLTGRWRCWFREVNYNWSPYWKNSKSLDGFDPTGNWTGWLQIKFDFFQFWTNRYHKQNRTVNIRNLHGFNSHAFIIYDSLKYYKLKHIPLNMSLRNQRL